MRAHTPVGALPRLRDKELGKVAHGREAARSCTMYTMRTRSQTRTPVGVVGAIPPPPPPPPKTRRRRGITAQHNRTAYTHCKHTPVGALPCLRDKTLGKVVHCAHGCEAAHSTPEPHVHNANTLANTHTCGCSSCTSPLPLPPPPTAHRRGMTAQHTRTACIHTANTHLWVLFLASETKNSAK